MFSDPDTMDREVLRCYYEFKTRKNIGPTGDFIEPGLYYTNEPFPAMQVQSDNSWYKLKNGTTEHGRSRRGPLTKKEVLWLELKAKYLNWSMVK